MTSMTNVEKWYAYFRSATPTEVFMHVVPLCVFCLFILWHIRWRPYSELINKIPGYRGHFIFGVTTEILKLDTKDFFLLLWNKFCSYEGGISKVWMFFTPTIFIYEASTAEVLLSSSIHIRKSFGYDRLVQWLGYGLLTSKGERWRTRRKMLTPAFHFKILEDFIGGLNANSDTLISKFNQKIKNGKPFDIYPLVTNCTLDVILETAMGTSFNIQDNPESDYLNAVLTISHCLQKRFSNVFLRFPLVFKLLGYQKKMDDAIKILHDFSNRIIKTRKEEYRRKKSLSKDDCKEVNANKRRLAFLDLLIEKAEEEGCLTDEDIREEVDTFVFEGHDTTAAAVSFCTYLVGHHPEIQQKIHQELDSIFGGSDRPATSDDLKAMQYLEWCLKEALRIYPSVPMVGRVLEEPLQIKSYTIPAQTSIFVVPYTIHRDPKHFPEPEKFIPERFSPESSKGRHPFAYVPFSAGPRNCIGQKFALLEEKAILSAIFRNIRVESVTPLDEMFVLGELILRPEKSIDVKMYSRSS